MHEQLAAFSRLGPVLSTSSGGRFLSLGSGDVHLHSPPFHFGVVHGGNAGLGLFWARESQKAETTAWVEEVSNFTELFNFISKVLVHGLLGHVVNEDFTALFAI